MSQPKTLVRQRDAARELGIKVDTFCKRKYPIATTVYGIKLYDIDELKAIKFIDKRRKNG